MTKFLKQTCRFERACSHVDPDKSTVAGVAVCGLAICGLVSELIALSVYGDILYEAPIILKCRRERYIRDMQTSNGAILKANSRYFLDEAVRIRADDRIDGHVILACEEYVDQFGACVGYEVYV